MTIFENNMDVYQPGLTKVWNQSQVPDTVDITALEPKDISDMAVNYEGKSSKGNSIIRVTMQIFKNIEKTGIRHAIGDMEYIYQITLVFVGMKLHYSILTYGSNGTHSRDMYSSDFDIQLPPWMERHAKSFISKKMKEFPKLFQN